MSTENQLQDAVLVYITKEIEIYKDYPDKWVCWNGAVIKIVDNLNNLSSDYRCQGTISEALYHIENGSLIYFLNAAY